MNNYDGRNGNGYQPLPVPPTTEYVGGRACKGDVRLGSGCGACSRCFAQMKDLPLLPSERRDLEQKVKDANARYEQAYDAARRSFTAIINNDESLSLEQKENILNLVWK